MQGVSQARQLATIPILRGAVVDSNRSYVGREHAAVDRIMREWERRGAMRPRQDQYPDFINKMATDYLNEWLRIRKAEYVAIFVTDAQGGLVGSSTAEAQEDQSQSLWRSAAYNGGSGKPEVSD